MDLNPALILTMWTSGTAAFSAVVIGWRIVGSGFVRLVTAVVVLFAAAAAGAGAGAEAWIATALAVAGFVAARSPRIAMAALGLAALLLILAAGEDSPVLLAVTGALFLGAITAEMTLGHWYLVDPQLPRWALHALAIAAGVALVADVVYLTAEDVFTWAPGDEILGLAFAGLAVLSLLLVTGVVFALREPSYTGVMAATGLSYLAVLTAFGVVVLGRLLAF